MNIIRTKADLARILADEGGGPHYVYTLHYPSTDADDGVGRPFYVGIGQGSRIFAHEEEANDHTVSNQKLQAIREIWSSGGAVVRAIDSVHTQEPWDREESLINAMGRLADGTGPLTNAQTYARSQKLSGVELRKYAADHAHTGDPNSIPVKFKLRDVRLAAGPVRPRSDTSVFGKVYSEALAHPGVTGEQLIRLLGSVDFNGNKSAYTQGGAVSASWLAGYIEGAYYRSDRMHLQDYPG